jgi:DNA-binding NarL/FixJ family response regulator
MFLFVLATFATAGALALIKRLRNACPKVSLLLLTQHEGLGFLRAAATAELSAVVHLSESLETFLSALEAMERGCRYRSRLIEERPGRASLKRSNISGAHGNIAA